MKIEKNDLKKSEVNKNLGQQGQRGQQKIGKLPIAANNTVPNS